MARPSGRNDLLVPWIREDSRDSDTARFGQYSAPNDTATRGERFTFRIMDFLRRSIGVSQLAGFALLLVLVGCADTEKKPAATAPAPQALAPTITTIAK